MVSEGQTRHANHCVCVAALAADRDRVLAERNAAIVQAHAARAELVQIRAALTRLGTAGGAYFLRSLPFTETEALASHAAFRDALALARAALATSTTPPVDLNAAVRGAQGQDAAPDAASPAAYAALTGQPGALTPTRAAREEDGAADG